MLMSCDVMCTDGGKNFVVHLSTTKTTKILPPEKYPLYSIHVECVNMCQSMDAEMSVSGLIEVLSLENEYYIPTLVCMSAFV